MRKLLLLFVGIIFLAGSSWAQQIITIGSGTANNSIPIDPKSDYSYSQVIYLQSEINAVGDITTLEFYYQGGNPVEGSATSIFFTETFEDDSPTRADWTQIQENGSLNWTFGAGTGNYGSNITTAFEGLLNARLGTGFDPADSKTKLITPELDLSSAVNPRVSFHIGQEDYYGQNNTTAVFYRISASAPWVQLDEYTISIDAWTLFDLELPNPSPTYQLAFEGTTNYGLPLVLDLVTVYGEEAGSAPDAVTNIAPVNGAINIENGSSLSWEFGANTDEYQLMLGTTNPPTDVAVDFTTTLATSYTLIGLEDNTIYYWQVNAKNANGTTPGEVWSFTTVNTGFEYAFFESFEGETFPPEGWAIINDGSQNTWIRTDPFNGAHTGTWVAHIEYNSEAHDDWLVTPGLVPEEGISTLSFWATSSPDYPELFNVMLSTTGFNKQDFTVTLASNVTAPANYEEFSYDLSAYNGQVVYVAVQAISQDQLYLRLDDFSGPNIYSGVSTPPDAVTNIAPVNGAINIENGSSLSWEFGANTSEYQLILGTTNPPTNVVVDFTTTLATSYMLVSLVENTTYYWQVNAKNENGTTPGEVWSFTTATAGIPSTFFESFEGETFPPAGWAIINDGGSNTWERIQQSNSHSGQYVAEIMYNSEAHDDWLITPGLVPDAENSTLSFWANSDASYPEEFNVKLSTTGINKEDFTVTLASNETAPEPFGEFSYDLSAYIGQVVYVAVQAISQNQYWFRLDDFSGPDIYSGGSTPPGIVTNIAPVDGAINVSNGSSLSWEFGANTDEYQLMLGTMNPPTNVVVDFTTNLAISYTLAGLAENTTYYWQVNARNEFGTTPGEVWSFTTGTLYNVIDLHVSSTAYATWDVTGGQSFEDIVFNFETGVQGWDIQGNVNGWQFGNNASLSSSYMNFNGNATNFIAVNADAAGSGGSPIVAVATSPIMNLGSADAIYLSFDYKLRDDSLTLLYSIGGGQPVEFAGIDEDPNVWINYVVMLPAEALVDNVQIMFKYTEVDNWSRGLGVDNISLTEEEPDNRSIEYYKVWLDGNFVTDTPDKFYQYDRTSLIVGQEYFSEVAVVYSEGTSEKASYTWTYSTCDSFPSPANLTYQVVDLNNVVLSWSGSTPVPIANKALENGTFPTGWIANTPDAKLTTAHARTATGVEIGFQNTQTRDAIEIHYDNGYANNGIGTNSPVSFMCAARFTPTELSQYYGEYAITDVKFVIHDNLYTNVTVKVWEGGSFGDPGTEVYSQDVTSQVLIADMTTVTLSEAVALIEGNEYWIGYAVTTTGGYPAGNDSGPMVSGKGTWMFLDGAWDELTTIAPTLDYNWVIRGIINIAEAPSNHIGTNIYRDGELIAEMVQGQTYTDEELAMGTYNYCVTYVYEGGGESCPDAKCVEVTLAEDCIAPVNLTATLSSDHSKYILEWNNDDFEGAYLSYGDLEYTDAIGLDDGSPLTAAVQFEPDMLAQYDGRVFSKIKMFYGTGPVGNVTIQIWQGTNLVREQAITGNVNGEAWNEFTFNEPVLIDGTKSYKIGYTASNYTTEGFPGGAQNYTGNPNSDFAFLDNQWIHVGSQIQVSWLIEAFVSSATMDATDDIALTGNVISSTDNSRLVSAPSVNLSRGNQGRKTRAFMGYNVYRDGSILNSTLVAENYFEDMPTTAGNYCYTVTAMYSDCGESIPSNEACVDFNVGVKTNDLSKVKIYPNPTNSILNIELTDNVTQVVIYNFFGQVVHENKVTNTSTLHVDVSNYDAGAYLVRFVTNQGQSLTQKIVVSK